MTKQINVRLGPSTLQQLDRLRAHLSVSTVDVIRLAVQHLVRHERLDAPQKESGNKSRKRIDSV